MPFTNYLDQQLLQYAFGAVVWTPPATLYVAVSSSAPTQAAANNWSFTEPAAGTNAYGRVALANNTTNFAPISPELSGGYEIEVAAGVAFPESTGPWAAGARLGYFGLFDAPTGGNLLAYGPLNPAVAVIGPGYQIEFPAGQLATTLT